MQKVKISFKFKYNNNHIESIKEIRHTFGFGLKEAKDIADNIRASDDNYVIIEVGHWNRNVLHYYIIVENTQEKPLEFKHNLNVDIKGIIIKAINNDQFNLAIDLIQVLKDNKFQ